MPSIEFESKIHNGIIHLPTDCHQWAEKTVRVIVIEKDISSTSLKPCRSPHPAIAGKGRTIGDLIKPIVDEPELNGILLQ
jgi:hypothetical protein